MKKIIKNEDLKNVNGGGTEVNPGIDYCPKCDSYNYTTTTEGSGCNARYHKKCNDCGHEWYRS